MIFNIVFFYPFIQQIFPQLFSKLDFYKVTVWQATKWVGSLRLHQITKVLPESSSSQMTPNPCSVLCLDRGSSYQISYMEPIAQRTISLVYSDFTL